LIHTSEIKNLLNLPSSYHLMMLIYVTILIISMLFSKQARGRPTWSLRATWCLRAPCWVTPVLVVITAARYGRSEVWPPQVLGDLRRAAAAIQASANGAKISF